MLHGELRDKIFLHMHDDDCPSADDDDGPGVEVGDGDCECTGHVRAFANIWEALVAGFWWECGSCSCRVDSDGEVDDESDPAGVRETDPVCTVYSDGTVSWVYCSPECRTADLERMRTNLDAMARLRAAVAAVWPGAVDVQVSIGYAEPAEANAPREAIATCRVPVGAQWLRATLAQPLDGSTMGKLRRLSASWDDLFAGEDLPSPVDWPAVETRLRNERDRIMSPVVTSWKKAAASYAIRYQQQRFVAVLQGRAATMGEA